MEPFITMTQFDDDIGLFYFIPIGMLLPMSWVNAEVTSVALALAFPCWMYKVVYKAISSLW